MELKKYKLGEIAEIIPGYAFKASDFSFGENIAIKIKDIKPPFIDINNADKVNFKPNDKYRLEYGDFVLAMTGATIGKVGLNNTHTPNVYINQRVCKFIPNEAICNKNYLYYLLSTETFRKFIYRNIDSSSAQPNIGHPSILKFEHYFPSLEEQKRIGNLLSVLDEKIELNRKINNNLEAMAKQLYDYWFVQFDFPNEEGKPYKSSGGKMVWNEKLKREIPEGWEVKDIKTFMRIFTGKKDVSKAIPGSYKFFSCAPEPITSNEYIYEGAAVLVSGNGSYTGRVTFYEGKMDLYQRTYACVMKNEEHIIPFFYYTLRYLFQPVFSGGKHGSSIPYIVLGDLADFLFTYNADIVNKFVINIGAMFKERFSLLDEIASLTKQRDELLPLLMNGQVSVK